MKLRREWTVAWIIARTHIRAKTRDIKDSTIQRAIFVGLPVFMGAVFGKRAYDLGRRLATGETAAVSETLRAAAIAGLLFLFVYSLIGSGAEDSFADQRIAFLTATETRPVAVGSLVANLVMSNVVYMPTIAIVCTAFAIGAGSPLSLLSFLGGSLWLILVSRMLAEPVGSAVKWVLYGYDVSENARWVLGVGLVGVVELLYFNRRRVTDALLDTPVSWLGDLFMLTVPALSPSFAHAGIVLVATTAVAAVSSVISIRTARFVWYSDPAFTTDEDDEDPDEGTFGGESALRTRLETITGQETAALTTLIWQRTTRTPQTLYYVLPAGFVGLIMAERLVFNGPFSRAFLPIVAGFAGASAIGSGFTLNPLGTEGDALPGLLTLGVPSEQIIRAKALAALLPGFPLVVGGSILIGLSLSSAPLSFLVAATIYAAVLTTLAPLLALAVGVHFPPDAGGILRGDAKIPHSFASTYYTAGLLVAGMPGFGTLGTYAFEGTLDPVTIASGVAVTLMLGATISYRAYTHAVEQLETYSIE